jgi:uncharacterized membrane protein
MRVVIIAFITQLIVMGVMDGAWISFAVGRLYKPGIGHLMADKPQAIPAVLFYLLYAAGVTYLVTLPALAAGGWVQAATRGAVFGLVAYGTYDLTSFAILRGWPANVTIADMIWGLVLTGVTAGISTAVATKFG